MLEMTNLSRTLGLPPSVFHWELNFKFVSVVTAELFFSKCDRNRYIAQFETND